MCGRSYKNDRHTSGIYIHNFPKDVAVWPKLTLLVVIEEILLFKIGGLMLRLGFEDDCHKHIPLIKLRELILPMNSAIKNAN